MTATFAIQFAPTTTEALRVLARIGGFAPGERVHLERVIRQMATIAATTHDNAALDAGCAELDAVLHPEVVDEIYQALTA